MREAEAQVKEAVKWPEGYISEFGGAFKDLQEARGRLAVLVPATLALIFVFVFMAFSSLRQRPVLDEQASAGGRSRAGCLSRR